ncbi:MAG: hypothetical protein M0Z99_27650 [Betaproteobacteria bacterium]|nr:hypothetical protein [Betaproteobacteria bacterium]
MPVQFRQCVRQRVLMGDFCIAVGAQYHQAAGAGLGHHEFEQTQRWYVGLMQVIDHQQ